MYKVFPSLILRAAMVRARSLELGGVNDYYTSSSAPSSSTLVAAAPSATNVYVLAFGEREGLAPGERLEVYGGTVRLVRTLAYGCPRGVNVASAFTGRLTEAELNAISEQLDALKPCGTDMRKLMTLHLQRSATRNAIAAAAAAADLNGEKKPSSTSAASVVAAAAAAQAAATSSSAPPRVHDWTLRIPEIKNSAVLMRTLPSDTTSLSGARLAEQLERLRRSAEEVVVAEWISRSDEQMSHRNNSSNNNRANGSSDPDDAAAAAAATRSNTVALTDDNGIPLSAQSNAKSGSAAEDVPGDDALLMENGVCFRSADSCGLRALRTARLAFISSIERTANGLARRQRRLSGEETRALAVLDVSAIDFTFAHAALQSTLELGLHTGEACRITHVPLNTAAAQKVEPQAASYIRVVSAGPGRALARPFDFLPTHSFDVGAYTAYLPLPLGPLTEAEAAGSCQNLDAEDARERRARASKHRQHNHATKEKKPNNKSAASRHGGRAESKRPDAAMDDEDGLDGTRADRQLLAMQLSHALATLRKGACMLVTFVPTPTTVAALYHEMETQHHAEVLIEHRMVARSKACIAEAISRTGRWGYITDEVLPAVDSPQGSSFSLMVVLE